MVIPSFKKLRSPQVSAGKIADLLEKHIGSVDNETRCIEALDQIQFIKDKKIRDADQVIALLLPSATPCERIRELISMIRGQLTL